MTPELTQLLTAYREAFTSRGWHGATLLESLKDVDQTTASWRPSPRRHNIWEVVVHAAYWKRIVRERLTGKPDTTFPYAGDDWFACPNGSRTFAQDIALLKREHQRLGKTIGAIGRALHKPVHGKRNSAAFTIRGIIAHDLYHAGQIQLLKALAGS
jgi:hypothetical protein